MTHTSTEQPEALPCPFCGGHSTLDSNGQDFRVFCWDCGAKSKEFDCWQKAEAAWNRRTPASQAQRVPLTDAQIHDWWRSENSLEDCDMCRFADFAQVVRALELKYGITQEKQG
ncbi:Lar family restriction alleviation protein [Comamonas jiangduensis]|uniref:Lar family restriction alleviation protein n=1 Tax=Comamonas jiangduensis TaxID=1194168 RepID=A0ABV4ICM3_9BURK